jgi:CRISPR-associated protein Csb2
MEACLAILSVRKTWTNGGSGDLHVAVAGHAELNHLQDFPEPLRPSLGKGTQWSSLTPFVPPRYLKKAGKNSLEGQILAELSLRNFPVPLRLEVKQVPDSVDLPESQRSLFRHFIRRRGRGGVAPPQDAGFFVRLVFGEEVQGPICLGYGSHFGMGVFRCEDAV